MSIMSPTKRTSASRTHRVAVLASLVALAGILTGCGAAGDYYPAPEPEAAYYDSGSDTGTGFAADGGYDDAGSREGSTNLVTERAVIITGGLFMTVEDPIASADRAVSIVQRAGGRIDARSETAPNEHYGGSAALTMRIPSSQLDAVINQLRELGTVDQFKTESYDVTNEVTDLAARISTLRASTERIEGLLADASGIPDIIRLEDELASRQAQLESLEARQRGLNDQVSMSTIDLSLTTEPMEIEEEKPEPLTFLDGLESGWNAMVSFFSVLLVIVGVLLPWLVLIALITFGVIALVRSRPSAVARRRAKEESAATVAARPAKTPPPPA